MVVRFFKDFSPNKVYGSSFRIFVKYFHITLLMAVTIIIGGEVWGQSQTFISSGSIVVPAGVTSINVESWGGGGGGSNRAGAAGAGGGGAYTTGTLTGLVPGSTLVITVGTGGGAGISGSQSIVSTIVANGGASVNNSRNGGAGGAASAIGGSVTASYSGGTGGNARANTGGGGNNEGGGGGGGSATTTANGGNGGIGTATGGAGGTGTGAGGGGADGDGTPDAVAGTAPGGGGGGRGEAGGTSKAGANGRVIISWTQPVFYSQNSGNPGTLANWNTNPGGGGYSPTSFTDNYQTFVVQSGHNMGTTGNWNVGGTNTIVQVRNAASITANNQITFSAAVTFQIDNGGTYNHQNTSTSVWGGTEILGATSVINYGYAGDQNVETLTYGNLTLSGSGTKTAGSAITVSGAFNASGVVFNTANNINFNGTTACGGSINATAGTATYAATATNIIAGSYNNLITSGASTLCGDITVNGTLTLGGQLNCGNYNIIINTTACGTGSINATGGTITYSNAATSIISGTYNNLTIASSVTTATLCSGTTNVTGTLALDGATLNINGSTLSAATVTRSNANAINIGTGTLTVNNNLSLTTSDPITFGGAGHLNVSGGLTCGTLTGNAGTITLTGAFTPNAYTCNTSTVFFNGTTAQTIPAFNYYNLTSNSTGSRTLAGAGTIGIAGTFTTGTNTYTIAGSTIDYNGTTSQPVAEFTYNNLNVSGTNTKTLSGNITVNNNLSVSGSANLASDMHQITGNASGAFSLASGTSLTLGNTGDATNVIFPLNYASITLDNASTVAYQSNSSQTVAGLAYGNLEINGGSTKTLASAVTVNNVLTLADGNLSIGNNNLTIYNAVSGAFDGSHMIVTGGTGAVVKQGTIANASMVYPIGTGAKYTPVTITGTAGASSGGIYIRAIDGISPNMSTGSASLSKYWEILTPDYSLNGGNITFTWHGTEVLGDPDNFSLVQWTGGPAWVKRSASSGASSLTHSLSNSVAGEWTTTERAVLYSYNTGNWHIATTWTTDPSGTEQIGSRVPQDDDRVVILNGYTVTLDQDVTTSGNAITVEGGAYLNLAGYRFTNTLVNLEGSGTIQSSYVGGAPSTGYFPDASGNTFVNSGGGTYEFTYAGALTEFNLPSLATYNNLKINITSGKKAVQVNDLTCNGNLLVHQGVFQINDATVRRLNLSVFGNVTVEASGEIATGTGSTGTAIETPYHGNAHQFLLYGNLTNFGSIKFSNQANPVFNAFPADGAVTVRFTGATNNLAILSGITNFYNLIIDKGTDKTYELEIVSSDVANFRLFGKNNNFNSELAPYNLDNPEVRKALWIKNGTLKLTGKINIPTLSEGAAAGTGDSNGDWRIGANARFWLASPDVSVSTTSTNAGDGTGVDMGRSYSALSIFGSLQMTDGSFTTNNGMGILFWNGASNNGEIIIEGGTVDASCFWTTGGVGKGSYYQSGGIFTVRGTNNPIVSDVSNVDPLFGIRNPNCSFTMTGGTINITNNSGSVQAEGNGFCVLSSAGNYAVTGGKINVALNSDLVTAFAINSTSNLWNLDVKRTGANPVTINLLRDLTVSNDLLIGDATTLDASATNYNLSVGGDFTLGQTSGPANGAIYNQRANTTTFIGSGTSIIQVLRNDNTTSPLVFNNLTINKSSMTDTVRFNSASRTTDAAQAGSVVATVNSTLTNTSGIIDYGAFRLRSLGNVSNTGIIGINTSTGRLYLNGTALQTISASVSGTPSIGHLDINGSAASIATQLSSDVTVNQLTLTADRVFYIGAYCFTVGSGGITAATFSTTRNLRTNNLASAGGLKMYITSAYNGSTVLFPLGTKRGPKTAGTVYDYFPARAYIGTVTTAGYYTVVPVADYHPSTDAVKFNDALDYYWKTKISSLVVGGTNHVEFDYYQNIPNSYNDPYWLMNNVWYDGSGVNNSPTLRIPTTVGLLQADVTSGKNHPFMNPTTYYSRQNGNWTTLATWSTDQVLKHAGAASTALPGTSDNIVIGDGVTYNHTVTRTTNGIAVAIVTINTGSTLDIGITTGHTLEVVSGQGRLRISSNAATATFPGGDFGSFLGPSGGTVEYYTTGTQDFDMPTTVNTYYNLVFVPGNGRWVAMPNIDVQIYNDFTVRGIGTGSGWINWYNTSRTFIVNRDFVVESGQFIFYENVIQTHLVRRNLVINAGASINGTWGASSGGLHSFIIYGDFINNGDCRFNDPNACDLTFTGSTNASITGTTGTLTSFRNVTVNKGTSQATTLTVDVAGTLTTLTNNWLTLQNGTLKFMKSATLPITTTSTFTIPTTACLHVENAGAIVNIANAASNNNDLYLHGKLKIVSGAVNIGSAANNNNNDIEYSTSGASEIEIIGGTLFVNGQIRRSLINIDCILKYNQTGGNVTINGRNPNNSRAKFELVNTGSSFTLTGGNLTLVRGGGGTTFSDLYIRPETYSTSTSGNIFLATTAAASATETFRVDASIPLSGLTVNGFDASHTATAILNINPLLLNGNLIINQYATFNTNNLDLSLTGNFTNNGIFTSGTIDVTTFNGVTQTLAGNNTTFCNLAINPATSVTLQATSNITVNKEFRILSGSLIDGGNVITVKGNLINYTTHTSSNPASGGIFLRGTLNQIISGNGSSTPAYFGRLELDNGAGTLLQQDVTINNALTLTNGSVNIDDQLLTIGTNAVISPGAGSFGISRMVYSNGYLTTAKGITIPLPALSSDITCPIGVNGKYTPVRVDYSANSTAGTVNIIALNGAHPTAIDPDNVLQYYWAITSNGLSGFIGDIYMYYLEGDVRVVLPEVESNYISGRLSGTTWTKVPGYVDATNNISQFPFTSSTSDITGDYTAGIDDALPTTVPTYYSNVPNGNWGDINSWTPLPTLGVPNGAIMVIQPGDNIIIETDRKRAYKTTINGRLDVGNTLGHYLGIVDGTGILAVTGQKLPAGRYDPFFSCTGGSLEYGDGGAPKDYTMSLIPSALRRLILSGGGKRIMPNKDITICELLDIGGTTTLDNSVNNRTIYLNGSMTRNAGASFLSGTGAAARVVFQGNSAQSIGTFTSTNAFNHIELNNNLGLTLNGPVDMRGNLTLTNGIITTTSTNILYMSSGTSTVSPAGGSSASFINGPLKKMISGGYLFQFPLGKVTRWGKAAINLPNDGDWTAEYFNTGHTGMASPAFASPLTAASTTEYWTISGPASKQAYVTLRWDPVSDIRPPVSVLGIAGMRVTEFNTGTSQWNEKNTSATGDDDNGTATTTDKMNLDTHDYTLGCIGIINARARFSSINDVCQGGTIPVEFTGITGAYTYTLSYSIDGVDQIDITGISSATTTITASSAGVYRLNGFTYNNPASPIAGIYDATTVTVNPATSTADAGTDQTSSAMCGLTSTTLEGNTPVVGAGTWGIVSGSGGTITTPTSPTSAFNGTAGVTYVLRWTISNDPCTPSTNDVTIAFHQAPAVTITGDATACSGTTGHVYSTESGLTSYVWSVTGGTITAGGSGTDETVTVTWGASGTGEVSVNYTNANGCSAALSTDLSVTIYALPVVTLTGNDTLCEGASAVYTTESGMSNYTWTVSSGGSIIAGGSATDNTATVEWSSVVTPPIPPSLQTVAVNYSNSNGCRASVDKVLNIAVYKIPETGPSYHIPNEFNE